MNKPSLSLVPEVKTVDARIRHTDEEINEIILKVRKRYQGVKFTQTLAKRMRKEINQLAHELAMKKVVSIMPVQEVSDAGER